MAKGRGGNGGKLVNSTRPENPTRATIQNLQDSAGRRGKKRGLEYCNDLKKEEEGNPRGGKKVGGVIKFRERNLGRRASQTTKRRNHRVDSDYSRKGEERGKGRARGKSRPRPI